MLDDGRIIYDGGLDELKARWGKGREVQFQFSHPISLDELSRLTEGMQVRWSKENEMTAKVWIPKERNVSDVLSRVVGSKDIRDIKIIETNTDEIVREIYQAGSAEHRPDAGRKETGSGGSGDGPFGGRKPGDSESGGSGAKVKCGDGKSGDGTSKETSGEGEANAAKASKEPVASGSGTP
jgi:ABC-2 type transport system ATP-binding protein